jgi:hypothetical protein
MATLTKRVGARVARSMARVTKVAGVKEGDYEGGKGNGNGDGDSNKEGDGDRQQQHGHWLQQRG